MKWQMRCSSPGPSAYAQVIRTVQLSRALLQDEGGLSMASDSTIKSDLLAWTPVLGQEQGDKGVPLDNFASDEENFGCGRQSAQHQGAQRMRLQQRKKQSHMHRCWCCLRLRLCPQLPTCPCCWTHCPPGSPSSEGKGSLPYSLDGLKHTMRLAQVQDVPLLSWQLRHSFCRSAVSGHPAARRGGSDDVMPSLPGSLSIWSHGLHSGALDARQGCRTDAAAPGGNGSHGPAPKGVETHDYDVLDGAS